ncbi:MAG: NgoPII family restriction endonuclease [Bifidobacteriaceae bacterium]|jgi:hypothetical protein|nr:NgoPII family restriction endonuclease [Bifidobacteriaceae bacterium]
MANILDAIVNIVKNAGQTLDSAEHSRIRINAVGDQLEDFVKDAFSDSFNADSETRNRNTERTFSYKGNQNNPPDAILNNGAAIEVKKIETDGNTLALNSSYPKQKLHTDDPRISQKCKEVDGGNWTEKDIIYAVGVTPKPKGGGKQKITRLTFVYGDVYCASREVYERVLNKFRSEVQKIDTPSSAFTKEIGRVNDIDPKGITHLRIRGMWGIKNPTKVFKELIGASDSDFQLTALIPNETYNQFVNRHEFEQFANSVSALSISDVEVENPDNLARFIKCKLVKYYRSENA